MICKAKPPSERLLVAAILAAEPESPEWCDAVLALMAARPFWWIEQMLDQAENRAKQAK